MKKIILGILFISIQFNCSAQIFSFFDKKDDDKKKLLLLSDRAIQIEAGNAVNSMYNFDFEKSDKEFRWFKSKYPDHPLGSFLIGLNAWWKIVPNTKNKEFDDEMEKNMDDAIDLADDILDDDPKNKEAAFFAAAAYAFKGRLYSEREKWTRAAWAGKQAMKFLEKSKGGEDLSPEIGIGDGLYNFYSKWIHEEYPKLKPIMTFFKKGNKQVGINQLEKVANNAFYTRVEARYFLVQIYAMEGENQKAYTMSKYMHQTYPNNPFFHRYLARESFVLGKMKEAENVAEDLLKNIGLGKFGYTTNEGRYASYIIAYVNYNAQNIPKAKEYYQKTIDFALLGNDKETGYYHAANLALGKIAESEGDLVVAKAFYKEVIDNADKKSEQYKEAKLAISGNKKAQKAAKKKN